MNYGVCNLGVYERSPYDHTPRVEFPIQLVGRLPHQLHRGEWAWFGRQDSPGNSNISRMHKDRSTSFNVDFQPRPTHVWSHIVFGLIDSFSCHSTFLFFGMCGVIFQSTEWTADDFKTYQFALPYDQGCFRMIKSCGDTDIRYKICLLINYLFPFPIERRYGEVSGTSGWGWFGRVIPMSVLRTCLNYDFWLKISDDIVQLVITFNCIQWWIILRHYRCRRFMLWNVVKQGWPYYPPLSNKTWLQILFTSSGGKGSLLGYITQWWDKRASERNLHMGRLINARNNPTDCPNLPRGRGNFGFLKWCHVSSSTSFVFKDKSNF